MSKYTEEEVKAAFWATFHKSGELWFDYFDGKKKGFGGSEEDCESCTQNYWDEFKENLEVAGIVSLIQKIEDIKTHCP